MDLLRLGDSFLNTEELVDIKKLHLLAKPFKKEVRVLEGSCHVCRPQQGLGACKCLWSIRNDRKNKTLAEHFLNIWAPFSQRTLSPGQGTELMAGGRRHPQQRHGLRVAACCLAVLPTSLSSDQGRNSSTGPTSRFSQSSAANKNTEYDAVILGLAVKSYTHHPFNAACQRASIFW